VASSKEWAHDISNRFVGGIKGGVVGVLVGINGLGLATAGVVVVVKPALVREIGCQFRDGNMVGVGRRG